MWLLLPAAGLLAVICCLNGYLVYKKLCDNEASVDQQNHRSLNRQSSDLVLTVKQWTESSAGQLMAAATVIAVCIYICFDVRMWAHPEVLLPFLVVSVCSIGGFVTYRYLAFAKLHQGPESQEPEPQNQPHGDSAADLSSRSSHVKWYDDWQKQSSRFTTLLVVLVGLASFQQAIQPFSAGTQLMITSCLAIPLCSLAGFMMYLSNRPHKETSSAEELQQYEQKLAAGLGMLLAFTAGFLGLRSSMAMPVLLVACFVLPLCCLAGFGVYQYQLYLHPTQSMPSSPDQTQTQQPSATFDAVTEEPFGDDTASPDRFAGRERLRQNSDIFMDGNNGAGGALPHAAHHPEDVEQPPEWNQFQPGPKRLHGDEHGIYVPDIPDGEEHQHWADGSEYFGEWRDGQPNGRGIFVSMSGDRHEGEWQDGKEHGPGTAVAADGSSFYGSWQNGKRHGEGVHKPASADNNRADIIFLREYNYGVMSTETVLRMADKDAHRKAIKKHKSRKLPDRRADPGVPKPGEHIFKGHRSYDLMRELQLGMMFSIANVSKSRMSLSASDVTQNDFGLEVSQYLRSHNGSSFKWKDYSPLVFQRLRQLFGIDNIDYLLSLTGESALRLLASPGKSGSAFFLSEDDRFLIKTVQQEEMRLLLELIPKYYRHVEENSGTLLTRFHGLHMVKPVGRAKATASARARFVVMGNVFPTDVRLHRRYDLKGSTLGRTSARKAGDPNTVLKDLDIDFQLLLNAGTYDQLMEQLQRDCALLESLHVMDYSLLLGVHYLTWGPDEWAPPQIKKVGSGISRAAANRNNPLHWISGGHTHVYPRCDNDESAPVTPSAGMAASSDTGIVSVASSLDDSALKGTPRSPGHVTYSMPVDDVKGGTWASQASLVLQQPLQDDSRQHSWTAGRPTPKYCPAATGPGHLAPGLSHTAPGPTHMPRTSLQTLSEEEGSYSQAPSDQGLSQSTQPAFSSFPPLAGLPTHAQTGHQQPPTTADASLQPPAVATARASPPPHQQALPLPSVSGPGDSGQQGHDTRDLPTRAVSPFESIAELPFTPPQRVQSILTSHHTDRVHYEENPLFKPLDSPDGANYRQEHQHVNFAVEGQMPDRAGLARTHSVPLRRRSSMKGCSQSPTRQELHAFETLLDGTGAQMPNRMQLLATHSMSSQDEQQEIYNTTTCRIGTDELTGSMRRLHSKRTRDQLGVSIPALAVPRDGSSSPQPVLIYFGIIDFLQEYRTKKKMEHVMKAAVFGGKTISVVDPHRYAKRFRHFMEGLFVRKGGTTAVAH